MCGRGVCVRVRVRPGVCVVYIANFSRDLMGVASTSASKSTHSICRVSHITHIHTSRLTHYLLRAAGVDVKMIELTL